jgi:Gene product 88
MKNMSMKFTTIGNAKKQTGLSYLGSVASSSKIAKGLKYNEMTYILYLAPASQSGYNVCPMSTEECRTACLTESGHNRIDVKKNNINKARIKKTKLFFEDREFFMAWLITEITKARVEAIKQGYKFSVRINGTSDISLESFKLGNMNILEYFPSVPFYDYTKVANRFKLLDKYDNYDLTYSFSGHNMFQCLELLNKQKGRVAMVFEGKVLPKTFMGYDVIDGDAYDMRYYDEQGVIVGLKFKKVRNKIDTANNKFIIPMNSYLSVYEDVKPIVKSKKVK